MPVGPVSIGRRVGVHMYEARHRSAFGQCGPEEDSAVQVRAPSCGVGQTRSPSRETTSGGGTMGDMSSTTSLLVLGERRAIFWVLSNSRTAFVEARGSQARSLAVGDTLLLYATRQAWRNPTRDRGRIIAEAEVTQEAVALETPLTIADRDFGYEVALRIRGVAPYPHGVELSVLVPQLQVFPDKRSWSARLRTSILRLPSADARLLGATLRPHLRPVSEVIEGYRLAARLDAGA